jgi:hypothetical protein
LPTAQAEFGFAMLAVLQYGCASQTKLDLLATAIIGITRAGDQPAFCAFRAHTKKLSFQLFCVSSDVTAEDRLARVLRNATLSANGW